MIYHFAYKWYVWCCKLLKRGLSNVVGNKFFSSLDNCSRVRLWCVEVIGCSVCIRWLKIAESKGRQRYNYLQVQFYWDERTCKRLTCEIVVRRSQLFVQSTVSNFPQVILRKSVYYIDVNRVAGSLPFLLIQQFCTRLKPIFPIPYFYTRKKYNNKKSLSS